MRAKLPGVNFSGSNSGNSSSLGGEAGGCSGNLEVLLLGWKHVIEKSGFVSDKLYNRGGVFRSENDSF